MNPWNKNPLQFPPKEDFTTVSFTMQSKCVLLIQQHIRKVRTKTHGKTLHTDTLNANRIKRAWKGKCYFLCRSKPTWISTDVWKHTLGARTLQRGSARLLSLTCVWCECVYRVCVGWVLVRIHVWLTPKPKMIKAGTDWDGQTAENRMSQPWLQSSPHISCLSIRRTNCLANYW